MSLSKRFPCLLVVGILAAALSPTATLRAGVPGDATTPPRTVKDPNPPPPKDGRSAGVQLGVWIRADGTVESVDLIRGDREWGVQAGETAKQWVFEPVSWEGKAIAARTEVSFSANGGKVMSSLSPVPNLPGERHDEDEFGLEAPVLLHDPEVILPLEGRLMRATPEVALRYLVLADGSPGQFEVLEARSEQALRAALDLVSVRQYRPGMIHGEPVAVEYTQHVRFSGASERIEGLDGAAAVADPVYPYDRLVAGEAGRARVRFHLSAEGEVASVAVVESTHTEFGAALVAAVETWQFTVAAAQAAPDREFEYAFELERVPYGARRLVESLREGGAISNKGAGLDARPAVLARPGLVYPLRLLASATAGSAKVEFVIDRSGLAHLPRVVEASAPEFGWAAATCVNGMRFAPISRGGKPAELRVLLPLQFTPPKVLSAPASPAAAN